MEAGPYSSGALDTFLQILPAELARALTVLSAAAALTDNVAALLINQCTPSEYKTEDIISYLHASDFVIERNSEWHFEPSARVSLLNRLYSEPALARIAHSVLHGIALEANPTLAGDTVPTYLLWETGKAYHTAIFNREEGLNLYSQAYTGKTTGDQWLLGILAEEQQEFRILPANAIQPPFFRGMTLYREGRLSEAERYLKRVAENREIREEVGIALHLLGLIFYHRHRNKEAEKFLWRSLKINEQLGNTHGQAKVLHSLATIIGRRNESQAINLLHRSLNLLKRKKDLRGQAQVLQSLGTLIGTQNRRKASKYLENSLEIEKHLNNLHGQAQVMHNLANLIGSYDRERTRMLFDESVYLLKQVGDLYGQAQVLHSCGKWLVKIESDDEGKELLLQSLEIGKKIKNLNHQAQVMNSLGNLFREQEDWATARQYYQQVLELNRDPRSKSTAHNGLSYIFEKHENNLELAIKHMKLATELIRRTNREDIFKKSKKRLLKLEQQYLSNNKS